MGSQRYTQQDLMNFDWDDAPLIAAYDKAKAKMKKQAKKQSSKKHSTTEDTEWRVGSYCRALYPEDGYYYEAKVLELDGEGKCTVEFFGYDDPEVVDVENLKHSKGKKARKSQIRSILEESVMSLTCGDTSDASSVSVALSAAKERRHKTSVAGDMPPQDFCTLGNKPQSKHPQPMPCCVPLPPYLPPPPLPPMPQCPSMANDPAMCAMLRSWYMAGYYVGLYEQTQKGPSYSAPCCCGHVNQCCQH